jgi:mRNA-degrading endonuclease RelE of RelBE toxin-antitoxin system
MKFIWPDSARAELRAVGQEDDRRILLALTRFADDGSGDVRSLTGRWAGYFRIRVGDYRVIFLSRPDEIRIVRVRHRAEAYR